MQQQQQQPDKRRKTADEVKANRKRQAAEEAALDRKRTMAQAKEAIEVAIKSVAASDQAHTVTNLRTYPYKS
jgi:hypothetical protein